MKSALFATAAAALCGPFAAALQPRNTLFSDVHASIRDLSIYEPGYSENVLCFIEDYGLTFCSDTQITTKGVRLYGEYIPLIVTYAEDHELGYLKSVVDGNYHNLSILNRAGFDSSQDYCSDHFELMRTWGHGGSFVSSHFVIRPGKVA